MLHLDKATHRYTWNSAPVPGVTSILKPLIDYSMVPPDVLERKRQIGDHVHEAIAMDLANDLDEASIVEPWAPYFEGWRKFRRDSGFVCVAFERPVYHPTLGYAGTFDLFGKLKGVDVMIDTKNTYVLHPAVGPQTAAYEAARCAQEKCTKLAKRYALRLTKDGKPRLHPLTDPSDWNVFLSLLNVHQFMQRHQL